MRRALLLALLLSVAVHRPAAAADRTFPAGSLIIPMDLSYQATGMFQAYGLVYQLLAHGIHVHWVIDPAKTWHANACNTAPMCAWDCGVEGSGTKCAYPTASPDFTATTKWIWDDKGDAARDTDLGTHRYRGGPFVIDAADHDSALAIIDAWNDPAKFAANPWADRGVVHVVTVHEATADFIGNVAREMLAAPTIAVFADGNEKIATSYLHAAGIPQSNGTEFPDECKGVCGPGTAAPDMLTPEAIAGPLGTCNNPNKVHNNGALFKADGTPAFCQIMSMHWGVDKRETFTCNPNCGTDPTDIGMCTGQPITFNGHEVVAEVRAFLAFPTHFFAECQAVNAYENTVPNPNYPWLDDPGRDGHFLTTIGTPPACNGNSCDTGYACVTDGCGVGNKCCLPTAGTWQNLPGFEVAQQPTTIQMLRPDVPYNQLDGLFKTSGGSEPAYNLSQFLGSIYKNNQQVTLITGPNGPEDQDVWMSGYLDGCQDIILGPPGGAQRHHVAGCEGKISYLGGHDYQTTVPVQTNTESLGTRLFLNALFEAQCTTGSGGTSTNDSDGDGVSDGADSDPNDPNKCGDVDVDGCDDCASGHFDPGNDCNAGGDAGNGLTGKSDGCCETGGSSAPRSMGLALIVGLLLRRRRRRCG